MIKLTHSCDNCGTSPIDESEILCNRCKYPTLSQLAIRGLKLRGTYRGPFCLEDAQQIISDLKQIEAFKGCKFQIVSQGEGFNVIYQEP